MFAVSVREFLRMTEAKPHQVLKQEGLVQQYNPTLGPALFVSHQWCARDHPDPHFAQLAVLQGFLREASRGEVQLQADLFSVAAFHFKMSMRAKQLKELHDGYMWYDYFSVPQPAVPAVHAAQPLNLAEDFGKAVMSIPAYVEMSRFFIILAPPVAHADFKGHILDYATWKQRGWCRLERAARTLSPRETTLLLVVRDNLAYQVGALDYILDSVGDGAFTVDSDRARLAPIVQSLVQNKLQALLQQLDLHRYRRVLAVRTSLLRGLPLSAEDCCAPGFPAKERQDGSELDSFLRLYGFSSATERSGKSEPILFAAMAGDLPVIRGLLERRACISTCEGRDEPEFLLTKGHSVLHLASQFARVPALVRPLVELRADLEAKDSGSSTPLHWAGAGGCAGTVDALIDVGADINSTDIFGLNALDTATFFGRREVVGRLLARGVPATPNADSLYPLTWATAFPTGADVVHTLLASRAFDPNVRAAPRFGSATFMLLFALSLPHRLRGSRQPLAMVGYHIHGATPLAIAAVMGHVAEARALLAGRADPLSRNGRGKTPAQLAELAGLSPDNVAFFRGPAAEDLSEKVAHAVAVRDIHDIDADGGTAVADTFCGGELQGVMN